MDIRKFLTKPGTGNCGCGCAQIAAARRSPVAATRRRALLTPPLLLPPVASQGKEAPAQPPAKKTKASPAPASAAATPAKSPVKSPAKTPASRGKAQAKPAPRSSEKKAAAKRKQAATLASDSDGEVNLVDSEFEVDLAGSSASDDDDDSAGFMVDDDSGEEDEGAPAPKAPAPKKRKSAGPADGEAAKAKTKAKATARKPAPRRKSDGLKGPLAGIAHDPAALAAVDAVDAAAAALPPEAELGITFLSEAAYNGRPPDEPAAPGSKDIPRGHPDCLTGKTFVISGVLDSLRRPEAEDLVKRHGGKVTGNVSSRTSFLVVGQHSGRTKYQTAKQHNTPIINEDGLLALIAAAPPPPEADAAAPAAAPAAVGGGGFYGGGASVLSGAGLSSAATAAAARPRGAAPAPAPAAAASDGQLWVDKWRPRSSAELVGNQTTVATLRQWLRDWDRVHLHGGAPAPAPGGGARDRGPDLRKKAALLSGCPGIGKTSAALIVARELGFVPVEVNASDTRSKADAAVSKGVGGKLSNAVKELSTNRAVSRDASGRPTRLCLVMDEVDGMSAGDRGGVADLIKTIAKSKVPIICICNDKYSQKLKSLKNHCLELEFRKPTAQQIAKRMLHICAAEGLAMNQSTMEALVQSSHGGDIRLILGQLQMVRLRARSLSYDQARAGGAATAKDTEMSPFEAARRLLDSEACSLSLSDQMDLVFQDADLVPLLVQENYVNHRPRVAQTDALRLAVLAKAADCISVGDVANRSVRQYQNWGLMPFAAAVGTVFPAAYARGSREPFGLYPGEPNFPRFTAWLGSNSSAGKQRRLLGELHTRMLSSGALECDRTALRLAYLPVLRGVLTRPLAARGKEGIPEALELMRAYCLAREDIDFIADVTKFKTKGAWGEDPWKAVETVVKSAFTRAFNAQHIKPRMGFGMEEGKKKGRGKKGAGGGGEAGGEEEGELEEGGGGGGGEEEEEEEEEADPAAVRQKLMGLKHKGMELTLKDGSKASKPAKAGGRGARGGGRGAASGSRGGGRGRGKK
jgi:replication factor C subunit 1